jgi:hypothetical protein
LVAEAAPLIRELDLLEIEPGAGAGRVGHDEEFGVQYIVRPHAARGRCTVPVIDNKVVNLCRVVRVREIVEPKPDCVIRSIGIHEKASLLMKIKAAFGFRRRASGAEDCQNGSVLDGCAVDPGTPRNDPKTRIRSGRVIDYQRFADGVCAVRQQ